MLVRPESRLVADSLERRSNERPAELSKAEEEYASAVKAEDPELSPARESVFMRWPLICPGLERPVHTGPRTEANSAFARRTA